MRRVRLCEIGADFRIIFGDSHALTEALLRAQITSWRRRRVTSIYVVSLSKMLLLLLLLALHSHATQQASDVRAADAETEESDPHQ